MGSLYLWIVFLHVAAILVLLVQHGGTAAVTYMLGRERNRERLRALLDLSSLTYDSRGWFGRTFWLSIVVMALSGIALMVMGGWWRQVWPWASIVLFIVLVVGMAQMGTRAMTRVRQALGMPYVVRSGLKRPEWQESTAGDDAALVAAQASVRPGLLAALGAGGFAIVLWLMMFKPF